MELQSQKSIWENRCFKLREYMRKLTAKCEEWESSYAQQSKLLEVLHSQQQKTKAKAAELGRKYSELTYDVQTRAEVRLRRSFCASVTIRGCCFSVSSHLLTNVCAFLSW